MNNSLLQNDHFLFGGDYNPEQWPEETWDHDLTLLKEANVNTVTLNVFSWTLLEPAENKFDFSLLDKILEKVAKYDLEIILATSTAALPVWLARKYPDVTRVDINGVRQAPGKRHNACPNSVNFQRVASGLVTQLVKHVVSNNIDIAYWHISNEYGGQCYCDQCAQAFQEWLKSHYDNIDDLNEKWNTNYWSHKFLDWSEIYPPMKITDIWGENDPVLMGAALDYRRFQSDSILANYCMEKDIIRRFDPITPVTTNLMATQPDLDYYKWAKEMDIISWDSYPKFNTTATELSFNHDLIYGLKRRPFLLMEQTPTQQTWDKKLKAPGEMRMESYCAVAHGANSVQFFQMKQSRNGGEKFHGAIIPHVNNGQSRSFKEIKQLGNELRELPSDLLSSTKNSKVALVYDWNNYWAFEYVRDHDVFHVSYHDEANLYYKVINEMHVDVDIISPDMDFSDYEVVVAPFMYSVTRIQADHIEKYVKNGGVFVTNYMSGIVDEHDNVYMNGYPGAFRSLLGVWVEEFVPLNKNDRGTVLMPEGKFAFTDLGSVVHLEHANEVAVYGPGKYYSGSPAITRNDIGSGNAYYIATQLNELGLRVFFNDLFQKKTSVHGILAPEDVEIVTRINQHCKYRFLINHSNGSRRFSNPYPKAVDQKDGKVLGTTITLNGFDVKILCEKIIKGSVNDGQDF